MLPDPHRRRCDVSCSTPRRTPDTSTSSGGCSSSDVRGIAAQSLVNVQDEYSGLGPELGNLVAVLVASAMLVLAMQASGVNRHWRIGIWITILISLSAHILAVGLRIVSDRPLGLANMATIPPGALALSVLSFFFVIHRLLRHRRVTASTLLGAITAYLFIPLSFYYAFLVVDGLTSAPFFGSPRPGPEFMFSASRRLPHWATGTSSR